jgi:hypothetical protein
MAGYKGVSGPPGNAKAFKHGLSSGTGNYPHESGTEASAYKHGLAAMDKQRKQGREPDGKAKEFRVEFYKSLVRDAGGAKNITAAKKYQAELISHDAAWLGKMIEARDNLLRDKPKVQANIATLAKLDSYIIRPVINSISTALDRFGYERANLTPRTLEDLFNEETEPASDTDADTDAEE